MGAVAARVTATLPSVTSVIVADRDRPAAQRVAAALSGHPGARPVVADRVDVTDAAALAAVLGDTEVVLNTVGPYSRFGAVVLTAAIATGTHYLDICDDPQPTTAMLALDESARAAGVTAIIGMGASPGISNLLAARAVARLDEVADLYTAWPVDVGDGGDVGDDGNDGEPASVTGPDGRPSAAAVHWMEQISGVVPVVADGILAERAPLQPVALQLPGGRAGTAYVVGHPEPLTLHASYAPSGDAACLMVITAGAVAFLDTLRVDIDAGRLDYAQAAATLGAPSVWRTIRAGLKARRFSGPGTLPPFFAAATGTRAGAPLTVLATFDGTGSGMAEATGVPLALGLAQVIDGGARRPGVWAPERIIDPDQMVADLDRLAGSPGGNAIRVTEMSPSRPDSGSAASRRPSRPPLSDPTDPAS
ncbi:hypothetical protein TUM20983_37340 [Mycobacterium antarcticum]|nr:hypothetical protein TUM20983_37340 [Mycolicibacterium sp. TUM20983]